MTELGCGVKTCIYNESNLCCRQEIKVNGSSAHNSSATFCDSFKEQKSDKVNNASCGEPEKATDIICEAVNCRYNENMKCAAKHVDVTGRNARVSDETECATFINR